MTESLCDDRSWAEDLSRDDLISRVEGWMRTAQTSEREIAWLRKALGVMDTNQSCAIRDAFERAEAEGPIPWEDIEKLTVSAFRGALWLERTWRESSEMWERRCNEATSANYLREQEVKRLREALEAIAAIADDQPGSQAAEDIFALADDALLGQQAKDERPTSLTPEGDT